MVEESTEEDWEELRPDSAFPYSVPRSTRYLLAFLALTLGSTAIAVERYPEAVTASPVPDMLVVYAGIAVVVGVCWWAETTLD